MKNLKSKLSAFTIFFVILAFILTLSSCSKQEKKEVTSNEDKNQTTREQPQMHNDSSMNMGKENMSENMNKDMTGKGNMEHKMIKIPSAQCDICKGKITKALNKVKGIKTFEVDIDNKIVHVNFDKEVTDLNKIENAITAAGYDANNKKANPDAYAKLDDCCKKPEDRENK